MNFWWETPKPPLAFTDYLLTTFLAQTPLLEVKSLTNKTHYNAFLSVFKKMKLKAKNIEKLLQITLAHFSESSEQFLVTECFLTCS